MKKKWNEKTKKTAVIASLIAVGVIAIAGISLCIYKDAPQKAEIAEAEVSEDMVEIPENGLTVPATEDTKAQEAEHVVVSTEISKEAETEDTHVQSIQPDLVGIDLFVPEVPFLCAGHLEDLLIDLLCRPGILFLAG